MRVIEMNEYPETRDGLSQDWTRYLHEVFPDAVIVPLLNSPDSMERTICTLGLDALILSNGNDWGSVPLRDQTEQRIIDLAFAKSIPLLGICRGMQVLNAVLGGELTRDIQGATHEAHVRVMHEIRLLEHTPFRALSASAYCQVNSFHRQGVCKDGIAPALKPFAITAAGVVEGLYHPFKPIVAMQWHPERNNPSTELDKKIITRLFTHTGL